MCVCMCWRWLFVFKPMSPSIGVVESYFHEPFMTLLEGKLLIATI